MARDKKQKRVDTHGASAPLKSSPFAALAPLSGQVAESEEPGSTAPETPGSSPAKGAASAPAKGAASSSAKGAASTLAKRSSAEQANEGDGKASAPQRAVVRFQSKGRGGKEVTLVERLDLPQCELDLWLKALKQSLGCGGVREDQVLVLQGDQRVRLPDLLRARGVKRVSCS